MALQYWLNFDGMPNQESAASSQPIREEEIDLKDLLFLLWGRRRTIALAGICAMGLSAIYAYLIAKPTYESSALLLPTQVPTADQFGAAAALLGKKSGGSADAELYQSLLTSRTVMRKLMDAPLRNQSDTAGGRVEPLYRILKLDTTKPELVEGWVEALSSSVAVGSKESSSGGILEIRFTAGAPWLAQEIGQTLLEIGQEELREVRVERAGTVLPRLATVVSQAKAEWDSSARRVTWYKDRNRSIILPDQLLELARLQMEQQVREQKYMLARKEYESQVLEREKATPPMIILDPANLPARKSSPKRIRIMALGLIAGMVAASGCIIGARAFTADQA